MDVSKILADLKAEREQFDQVIVSLERLVQVQMMEVAAPKRRGRPRGSKNKVHTKVMHISHKG